MRFSSAIVVADRLYCATACNATHGMAREKAVCPSVCPSDKRVDCDKTKESFAHILILHERPFILTFWQEEWLVGQPLLSESLGPTDPVGAKTPIFNRYSFVDVEFTSLRAKA